MHVHLLGWIGLIAIIAALITVDIVGHVRKPHAPTMKEATTWSIGYISLAVLFGVLVWAIYGGPICWPVLCRLAHRVVFERR